MKPLNKKPLLICFVGVDGVGKTTQAKALLLRLRNKGVRCKYTWLRFRHFISLFLLAYCRLAGLTKYTLRDGQRIGHHEFYRSKIISFLYPWVLFVDMLPIIFKEIFIPLRLGYTIVCDRFIYDTLVDLMIDTKDNELPHKNIGKLFLKLTPKEARVIILDLDEFTICRRREVLAGDKFLKIKRELYHKLSKDFDIPTINNDGTVEGVRKEIVKCLGL